jgi:hypothetical protein
MDVTSISTGRDHLKDTIPLPTNSSNTNGDSTGMHHHESNTPIKEHAPKDTPTEEEVFLSRPFPFTPRQSVSSQSLQSLDSFTGSSSCGEFSDGKEESFVPLDNISSDSLPGFEPSLNSINISSTEMIHDQEDFFEEHVKFLRNQTQPQRVQELNLIQSKMPCNKGPNTFHAYRF